MHGGSPGYKGKDSSCEFKIDPSVRLIFEIAVTDRLHCENRNKKRRLLPKKGENSGSTRAKKKKDTYVHLVRYIRQNIGENKPNK